MEELRAALAAIVGAEHVEAHIAAHNAGSAGVAKAVGLNRTDELDDGEVVWRS